MFESEIILATLFYSILGIVLFTISLILANKIFKLDMHRELIEDQNIAYGVLFGCLSLSIGIIIAASIV